MKRGGPVIKKCYVFFNRNTAMFFLLLAVFWPGTALPQTALLTDDLGFKLELKSCPQRIVSLAPNLTEILFALGLNDQVVGVTRFCDYPAEARAKTIVGGLVDPNLEIIQSLHPDLVLGFRGNPQSLLERLRRLSLPLFVFEQGQTFDDLFRLITRIGQLTCRTRAAEELVNKMRQELSATEMAVSREATGKKVFLTIYGQGNGLWTCGRDSYMSHLLEKAGARSITAEVPGNWLAITQEQIIAGNPEIILILCQDEKVFEKARKSITELKALRKIKAIKLNHLFFLEENVFSRFGPRLIRAYQQLVHVLYSEIPGNPR